MAKVSLRAYNREIEAMIDRNHLDEAVAHCRHILQFFPKHLDTYRLLGKAYLEYKRYPEAVDIFSRILATVPNDFVANVGMSIIRDEENRLDDAIWHMERAFETQPSNAAIQSELQRLYGRRDGVQLPRIRMTHGALAHMYVKGELYPQALSEIRSVLKEDPGRKDMQLLLAQAYYRSGAKNDAAEAASAVLRTDPYCLDANRILVELLGADHPENVQAYRQRVVELDPYAAQVSGSMFQADDVPDAAVSLERLDWDSQPASTPSPWETKQTGPLEGAVRSEDQPDWLKNAFGSGTPPLVAQSPASPFDAAPPAAPAEDIPDFLRAAGWGQATGAFDESKAAFADEPAASDAASITPGDLPDWVKAMAPEETTGTPPQEEELPDWINKIDKSALPASAEPADLFEATASQPAQDQPDWLKQLSDGEAAASTDDQPDWLKGFENESPTSVPSTGELDWLSTLGEEAKPQEAPSSEFDFLNPPAQQEETIQSRLQEDDHDLWKELGLEPDTEPAAQVADDFDFLNELADESQQLAPSSAPAAEPAKSPLGMSLEDLGKSEQEQDDSFAWLESLAAKQGATEGLLTTPEERLDEEPDWVKQAKGMEIEPPVSPPPAAQPVGSLEDLGKSEQEQDDSFAWLESLAAKQGATEGLLTTPEERLEEEPEWVRQAKSMTGQTEAPAMQIPHEETHETPAESQPTARVEDLGKSAEEQDDAFAWLESLAAKQGATEGLLTTPEERLEQEPDWVKQAKDVSAEHLSTPEQTPSMDDTAAWLRTLDEEDESAAAPLPSSDDTAMWIRNLEESQRDVPPEPVQPAPAADLPAWMQGIEEDKASETLFNIPVDKPVAETPVQDEPVLTPSEDLPSWMHGVEEDKASETLFNIPVDEPVAETPVQDEPVLTPSEDLPAWMQGIEEDKASDTDFNIPALQASAETGEVEPAADTEWMSAIEQESAMDSLAAEQEAPREQAAEPVEGLPSWLSDLDQESERALTPSTMDTDLPDWLRDEAGELLAEPTRIEPTRATDWHPVETSASEPEAQPALPEPEPVAYAQETPQPAMAQMPPEVQPVRSDAPEVVNIIEEKIAAVQGPESTPAVRPPKAPKVKGTGRLGMPLDPVLGQARNELSGSNLTGALEGYNRLIRKGRFLDEVIYDLRDALYRFPVDVDVWQSLGDAYMRANRLQDALDAYTKAEELLR